MAFYSAFWGQAYWNQGYQVARNGAEPPPSPSGGGGQGAPVGWGTGRKHGVAGQRYDDIRIERRKPAGLSKLRIQEIDNHDIMLFVKTFRQYRK